MEAQRVARTRRVCSHSPSHRNKEAGIAPAFLTLADRLCLPAVAVLRGTVALPLKEPRTPFVYQRPNAVCSGSHSIRLSVQSTAMLPVLLPTCRSRIDGYRRCCLLLSDFEQQRQRRLATLSSMIAGGCLRIHTFRSGISFARNSFRQGRIAHRSSLARKLRARLARPRAWLALPVRHWPVAACRMAARGRGSLHKPHPNED